MRYALLIYNLLDPDSPERTAGEIDPRVWELLGRPCVAGWFRLRDVESATTVVTKERTPLLVDGPFVDSKEYVGGIIVIDVDDLDAALAYAKELEDARPRGGAVEVRPVLDSA